MGSPRPQDRAMISGAGRDDGRTVVDDSLFGIRRELVEDWLAANLAGARGPFAFELITGGESNFTFRIADASGARYVLRRPPEGHLAATAHDVLREARIMRALASTAVPVPAVLATCDDLEVTGAPFSVMGLVEGLTLRTSDDMRASIAVERRADACKRLVEAMAAIHGVDIDAVGLGDLAKREGYVDRQLKRWRTQWETAGSPHAPAVAEIHEQLVATRPQTGVEEGRLVHGDYRFDNALVGPDGEVRAVLDWELATLGEPLADFANTMAAWSGPGEAMTFGLEGPTSAEGCLSRTEAIAHYAAVTGRDVSSLPWYMAWAHWRTACILSGVWARNTTGGGRGTQTADVYLADLVGHTEKAREWLATA
jgi:aminoglycoside phosphotransferase (APT) family kinase protein